MPDYPQGNVTFLFTDIEGSTRLWEAYPDAMRTALARHDAMMQSVIASNQGVVFETKGDAFCAAFADASNAIEAALEAQIALLKLARPDNRTVTEQETIPQEVEPTVPPDAPQDVSQNVSQNLRQEVQPTIIDIRVRMAIHTDAVEMRDEARSTYFGPPLNRIARLLSAGHGGQVLISESTEEFIRDSLPASASLRSLGQHLLRDLSQAITVFQLLHPALPANFPPIKSIESSAVPNNLPEQITSFIGREQEGSEVKELLTRMRLVTLTGIGGAGKTRLSLQVAADILADFPDGIWFVELATIADAALVPQCLIQTLGLREEPDRSLQTTLIRYLQSRRTLLILDNCEHLIDATAQLVSHLVRSCSQLKILATSREPLTIAGERIYRVPCLSLPSTQQRLSLETLHRYSAIQLFIDRAQCASNTFAITIENMPLLVQICEHLEGLPLAIELAAAHIRSMSIEVLNAYIDDRFRLRVDEEGNSHPRQGTLRGLIDWSYHLLTPEEQRLFERLTVFVGGWTLDMAQSICIEESRTEESVRLFADADSGNPNWEAFDLLTALADKSLIVYDEQGEAGRYRMLETLREYGQQLLNSKPDAGLVRARHSRYFRELAGAVAPRLQGDEQGRWLRYLGGEMNNLRAALLYFAEADDASTLSQEGAEQWLEMICALVFYWYVRGPIQEGREWLDRALKANENADSALLGRAFNNAGALANLQGDRVAARHYHLATLDIFRRLDRPQEIARSLNNLALVELAEENFEQASVYLEECLKIYREQGCVREEASVLANLGLALINQQKVEQAQEYLMAALNTFRSLKNTVSIAGALEYLCSLELSQNRSEEALTHLTECVQLRRAQGNQSGLTYCLEQHAQYEVQTQKYERAVSHIATATAHRATTGRTRSAHFDRIIAQTCDIARQHLDDARFQTAWNEGATRSLDEAIDEIDRIS